MLASQKALPAGSAGFNAAKLGRGKMLLLGILAPLGLLGTIAPASADAFSSYSCDASFNCSGSVPVNGGNFDLTSNATTPASGLYLQITGSLTLSQIVNLSAEYNMTQGAFGGGAPRFSIFDTTSNPNNGAYIYWGTTPGLINPNPNGTFANTGNYADLSSPDLRVFVNGFGGQNTPNTGETWSAFVTALGSTAVDSIYLDLDGGFTGAQELLVSNFTVNSLADIPQAASAVPEPATLTLFGAGLAGLAAFRRRRKAKA